ncbi:metal ABC transporter solute-binding protein, Zn/Mn family [Pseudanabaena sp. PCC 6802]|uniref:metal ABC transporter solute-binding protein, Zn/Mn family n=1 Tax=Pseudanabaena sp. PCC 6802 TaxID=118173 RepID=UPI000344D476|nr:zinc ABC transporter substrate-binding protein [Pseudanabaena sp. PCC 6802]
MARTLFKQLSDRLPISKGITKGTALLAVTVSLVSCSPTTQTTTTTTQTTPVSSPVAQTTPPANRAQVVATNSVLCGLTQQIAADTIALKCLISPGSDPHVYQPTPEDRKAIETSKLILYGGYDFEPSLIKLISSTSNPAPKIAVNELAVTKTLEFEDRGQKVADPHVWNDAKNGIAIAEVISEKLSALQPEQANTYKQNTTRITNELQQIDAWIKSQVETIPPTSRKLVTTHDALGYYSKAYNIPVEGALGGISTEEQPTPTRVKELVKVITDAKVPTIFAEVTINPKLIETVAKEAKVKVSERELYADGLGEKGSEAETYAGMLIANTRTIVEGLGGKYTPFTPKAP